MMNFFFSLPSFSRPERSLGGNDVSFREFDEILDWFATELATFMREIPEHSYYSNNK